MKRGIVFGGAGFIGSEVVKALLRHGVDVCAVVKPGFADSPEQFRLNALEIPIIECDLRQVSHLKSYLPWDSADVFYQLAWEGLSSPEILDYTLQLNNVKWMMDAIVAASDLKCKKFIGAGSISQDELHTSIGRLRQNDRHRFFRSAALMCEYMGQNLAQEHGIEFIWPIIANVYGEGELNHRLITVLIQKLLEGKSLPLSAGTQIYDFLHISDAGEAFYLIGTSGKSGREYRITSGRIQPLKVYLEQVRQIVNPKVNLIFGAAAESDGLLTAASFDNSVLCEDTGFTPAISFEKGITQTAQWIWSQTQNSKR